MNSRTRVAALAATLLLLCTTLAGAATRTFHWAGGADPAPWSTTANWVGGLLPQNGDAVVIELAPNTVLVDIAGLQLESLTIANSTRLDGQPLTLTGANPLTVAGAVLDAFVFNRLTFTNPAAVTTVGSGVAARIVGEITGAGGLVLDGGGLFMAMATSTFAGSIDVRSGTLFVAMGSALPATDITVRSGGTLFLDKLRLRARSITQAGGTLKYRIQPLQLGAWNGVLEASGPVSLGGPIAFDFEFGDAVQPHGMQIALIEASSAVSGTFSSLPEGATLNANGQDFIASYRNNRFTLEAVSTTPAYVSPLSTYQQSVRVGGTLVQPIVVRAFDNQQRPMPGTALRFDGDPSCGSFGTSLPIVLTTDASGTARLPDFTAGSVARSCNFWIDLGRSRTNAVAEIVVFDALDPTSVELDLEPTTVNTWLSGIVNVTGVLRTRGGTPVPFPGQVVNLEIRSTSAASAQLSATTATTDAQGRFSVTAAGNSQPGTYFVFASFGNAADAVQVTQRARVDFEGQTGTGTGGFSVHIANASAACQIGAVTSTPAALTTSTTPFAGARFDHGLLRLDASGCAPGSSLNVQLLLPQPVRDGGSVWQYGPTADNRSPHWYPVPYTVSGGVVEFTWTDGGPGDDNLVADGSFSGVVGFAAAPSPSHQDLWWSGPAENGWGMSVVQHGDTLFAVIYGYAASGAPAWWVMSGGTWNAAHTAYTGAVYTPRGSPFFAYDPSRLAVGAQVGSITLTFTGDDAGTLDFTIDGVTGRKSIRRQAFGPAATFARSDLGDMWWGGSAQNGWGIAVLQQFASLFSVWFTYDAAGQGTWFVMPAGSWTSPDTYEGRIYRTRGSPWLGHYDPGALQVIDVGAYRLQFTGQQATFGYEIDGRVGSLPLVRQSF